MQTIFRRLLDNTPLRLSLTAIFVTVPLTITTSWLAASYRVAMRNRLLSCLMIVALGLALTGCKPDPNEEFIQGV